MDADDATRRFLWRGGKIALAVLAAGAAAYWLMFDSVPVKRHEVSPGEIVVEVMGTGTLDAQVKATISTTIPGRLKVVLVDQGDEVKADQELARLDEHDLSHEVEVEEANVAAKSAAVERFNADVAQAKATLTQATSNESRIQRLVVTNSASRDELDKAVESLDVARAGVTRADAALVEARRQLVVTERFLEFRLARLEDAVIRAPFAGVVIRRDRNVGDVVVPGSSIFAVVATNELWVNAWVDESAMADVRPKQRARVVFRSRPNETVAGAVVRTGRETDRETREYLVDVAPADLPEDWSIGQRAEVYIETARKSTNVVLPRGFLSRHDGEPAVFIDVDGRATVRLVTLGLRSRDSVEVVEGLTAGETVLAPTRAGTKLTDGQRVSKP
jgi:HlyD family secretion protein